MISPRQLTTLALHPSAPLTTKNSFVVALIIQLIISYIYQFKYSNELSNISKCGRAFTDYKVIYPIINKYNFKKI